MSNLSRKLPALIKTPYYQKVLRTQRANLLAYWPMWEASGAVGNDISGNARHGAYTGVDLGQPGMGDGHTCPWWDGVNDYLNVYSTSLRDAFNSDTGTVMIWCKVNDISVWADASARRAIIIKRDWSNYISLHKESGGSGFDFRYQSPGFEKNIYYDVDDIGWFCAALTWDRGVNEIKAYIKGSQYGATQSGMAVWDGAIADAGIGSRVTHPTDPWHGWLGPTAIWSIPLTQTEITRLATV